MRGADMGSWPSADDWAEIPASASELPDADLEIEQLGRAITEVELRLSEVRIQEADAHACLREEVPSARSTLQELQRRHDAEIDAVRSTTQTEVYRILEEARRRVPSGALACAPGGDRDVA